MVKRLFLMVFFGVLFSQASGQFVYEGRGPANIKWKQIKADEYKILYPDYFQPTAIRMSGYLDSLIPSIRYGMKMPLRKIPIVLETQNQLSNGMVVWAPKREELVSTAPVNTYANPWLKQLSVHEFRHVTQISNLKSGLTKIASWVLGEAGMTLGMLVISGWEFEGDATNAETQLAEFGRGLQPSFTIGYRAMDSEKPISKYTLDQLIIGSYKRYFPNEYEYGYQVVRATETYCEPEIWGKIFKYSGRWPIFVVPDDVYLKHNYKLTTGKIAKRAFQELSDIWKPHSEVENNYKTITKPGRSYTTYQTPIIETRGVIFAQKKDFDNPNYMVAIDTSGVERRLTQLGAVSSRPILADGALWWTEYESDLIYEKRNFSVIRRLTLRRDSLDGPLKSGRVRTFLPRESNYLITRFRDGFATMKHDSLANSYIQFYDENFNAKSQFRFNIPTTIHGLAWDWKSNKLGFIALDDRGMWLGALKDGKIEVLRAPSVVTISELSSETGKFYYGSIESGKDEIHAYDIESGIETRLTTSKFGAFQGCANGDELLLVTYGANGYMLAKQKFDSLGKDTVEWSRLPQDKLNGNWVKWKVDHAKIDTLAMDDTTTKHQIKRYSKTGRRFNFHSWAPIAVDLNGLLGERGLKLGFGGTGFFQSTLGDMRGSLSLGSVWGRFWGLGEFTYSGLPVQLSVRAEYDGGDQLVYGASAAGKVADPGRFFSITGELFAPLRFSSGATYRTLTPKFSVTHYNAKMYDIQTGNYNTGLQRWDASIAWNVSKRTSYRTMKPRLGYAVLFGVSGAFNKDFSTMYTGLVRGYLPGILPNHSITLNASYQTQKMDIYNFSGKTLRVRGVVDNFAAQSYSAATFDYTFPIFYPDFGIPAVLHFKRIGLNLFADYSHGKYFNVLGGVSGMSNCSAGFDLLIDFSLIRSFDQQVTFSFAFPKNNKMFFSVGYNFGF